MRCRWMIIGLAAFLPGCSWLAPSQKFSVYFQSYSAELDQQALQTAHEAASFARTHPLQTVTVDGFAAPPDPKRDIDGLSAQRAQNVKQVLVSDGVGPERITTEASGIVDPKNLPSLAERRVDITIGKVE